MFRIIFRRVVVSLIVAACLMLFHHIARADTIPSTPGNTQPVLRYTAGGQTPYLPSKQEAADRLCRSPSTITPGDTNSGNVASVGAGDTVLCGQPPQYPGPYQIGSISSVGFCGETQVGAGQLCPGTPTCPSGYTISSDGASCTGVDPCPAAGTNVNPGPIYVVTQGPNVGNQTCVPAGSAGSCTLVGTSTFSVLRSGAGAAIYDNRISGPLTSTGEHCTPAPPLSAPPAETPTPDANCRPPQTTGSVTVGGTTHTVCYTPDHSVTTAPPATTTTTTTPPGGAPVQSTTTTNQTSTTDNGQTTVTTTTTTTSGGSGPGGSGPGSTTTTQTEQRPADSFCAQNPSATICKQSSFSGSCAGGFDANGDAITGAIAKEQYRRNCELFDTPRDEATLYENIASGNDPRKSEFPWNAPVEVNLPTTFDTSSPIAAGCIADRTVTVLGRSVVISFTKVCDILPYFRYVLMACAMLVGVKIVMGGVQS